MKNNVKKNFIYNIIYQILILIIPLICAPYLSRTLGSSGIGTYSYVYSIVYYFMIFTLLGVENYGNRTIAKNRDNREKKSKSFLEIYCFQFFCGLILLIIYLLLCSILNLDNKIIFIVESLFIVSSMFDINWFFFGIEKFKATITRNVVVKVLSLILIFMFVKTENDLWKYALIMSVSTLLSQLLLFPFLKNEIDFYKIKTKDIIKHIIPNLKLFIPVIAVSIFKMIDKVMIGLFSTMNQVGFYENAEKLIKVPVSLISALGVVMMPRITNLLTKQDDENVKRYILNSIKFINFISFPMMFGLMAIAKIFVPIFYGEEFAESSTVLILLSLTIPVLGWSNVIRTQYLIPKEKDKVYICSAIWGAIINIIINIIFIPKYGAVGACFGTILSEIFVAFIQSFSVRNELYFKTYKRCLIRPIITGLIMLLITNIVYFPTLSKVSNLFLKIIIACIVYFILNINYILTIVDINKIIKKIIKK